MRTRLITPLALTVALLGTGLSAWAQNGNSLSSSLDVYVFPAKGQTASQQSIDESTCFDWAVSNTGFDPFKANKNLVAEQQAAAQAEQEATDAKQGAGLRGALRGAVAGAVIGKIADKDTGHAAGTGAALGAIASSSKARAAEERAHEAAETQLKQEVSQVEAGTERFNKAFSACMEGKNYTVK